MKYLLPVFALLTLASCAKDETVDIQETAQQVGDVMASVDESGGNANGMIALMDNQRRFIALREQKLNHASFQDLWTLIQPLQKAQAGACKDTSFSACTSSQKVRDLNDCTIGSAVFSGDITLSFSDAACVVNSDGDNVRRAPNFTVTGRRGATLTVSKTGTNGQTIARTAAGVFTFANDGIRRVFTLGSNTLFDYTTTTTSNINITGTSRADRVMTGGNLRVLNNVSSVSCDYVPNNVTWSSSCNCASSGSWTGTCSDGKNSTVTITGCGAATIVVGEDSESLTFDRCYSTN
ncbi:hypothetical protein K2X05_01395 [bacterium]|nr:hypothetical protein [bacterium]